MLKKEDAIAYCALGNPPSDQSMVLIRAGELLVRNRYHDKVFLLDQISNLSIDRKVLLLPTILGGIIAPLFLVAGINGLGNLWLMITLSFAGLLSLYFGLSGSDLLIVHTRVKEFDFFVSFVNPGLQEFCDLFNQIILPARNNQLFCKLPGVTEHDLETKLVVPDKEKGLELIPANLLGQSFGSGIIVQLLSPLEKGYSFSYNKSQDRMIAFIHSDLASTDYIVYNEGHESK